MNKISTVICFSIILFGILEMLLPDKNLSVVFKKLLSIIIIISMLSVFKIFKKENFSFSNYNLTEVKPEKVTTYEVNVIKEVNKNLKEEIANTLEYYGYNYSNIEINTEYLNGQINIKEIIVTIYQYNLVNAEKIKSLLYEKYNINIIVKES